jgi:hypothetical protein
MASPRTRKTIALVSNTAWYLYNLRLGVIHFLQSKGFEILAIAPNDDFMKLLEQENCKTVAIEMDRRGTNPLSDVVLMRRLHKIYRDHKPDFIIHYTIKPNVYGSLAAKAAGIPSIAVVSGLGYAFSGRGWLYKIVARLMKTAFAFAKEVWFVNKDDRDLLLQANIVSKEKNRAVARRRHQYRKVRADSKTIFKRNICLFDERTAFVGKRCRRVR